MSISWIKTEQLFKTTEITTTTKMRVVATCDKCLIDANRILSSVKQVIKRNNGIYLCHFCATKNKKFRYDCSKRAKEKWKDPEYCKNNLTVVKSMEYRNKKKEESIKRWQDPVFRKFMMLPEMRAARSIASSKGIKKKWKDPKYRIKLIKRLKERMVKQWRDDDYREHMSEIMSANSIEMWRNGIFDNSFGDSFCEKMVIINREILSRDEVLDKLSAASKNNWLDPEYREAVINGNKEKWLDPEYREKMAVIRANQPRISSLQIMLYGFLRDLNIKFYEEGDNTAIGYYAFDCMVPKQNAMRRNLLIECQGDYWHSLPRAISKDKAKFTYINRYFPEHEIMYIWEHEFYTDSRVLDRLKLKLGLEIETVDFDFDDIEIIVDLPSKEVKNFLSSYYYIGRGRGGITFGVKHGDRLIGVAVFSPLLYQNNGDFRELSRFCVHPSYHKKNFISWLLSRIVDKIDSKIIAYSDTTVGYIGTIYGASDFQLSHEIPSDYWYVDNDGYVMHRETLCGRAVKMKIKEAEFAGKYGYRKKFGGPKFCYVFKG